MSNRRKIKNKKKMKADRCEGCGQRHFECSVCAHTFVANNDVEWNDNKAVDEYEDNMPYFEEVLEASGGCQCKGRCTCMDMMSCCDDCWKWMEPPITELSYFKVRQIAKQAIAEGRSPKIAEGW